MLGDMFDPLPFDLHLNTRWLGHPLYFVAETDSTNRLLRNLAPGGTTPGTVLFTDYQSAGRGRQGRHWNAPPGSGLLFSILLPSFPTETMTLLPIVTAVAVARAYERHLGVSPFIKWPNDLLVDGRKCGGILVEGEWSPGGTLHLVVGIGLNINQSEEDLAALPSATSLRAIVGRAIPRAPLFAVLLEELERAYDAFADGWAPHAEWSRRAGVPGQPLWVHTVEETPWSATAIALGAGGELVVNDSEGHSITLHAGDVSVRYVQPENQI
jgi:BirA family biotin operon repressor/biotin-[acetyl-CoA-carboxylase] ligase